MSFTSTMTAMERFMDKVTIEPNSGCWLWMTALNRWGYGVFYLDPARIQAHRASWLLHRGPIPDGLCVLHHCDNPPCVNPNHLFLGTHSDNAKDRNTKGRAGGARGVLNSHAKLTMDDVSDIRRRSAQGESGGDLARAFGVTACTVHSIVNGKTWRTALLGTCPAPGTAGGWDAMSRSRRHVWPRTNKLSARCCVCGRLWVRGDPVPLPWCPGPKAAPSTGRTP